LTGFLGIKQLISPTKAGKIRSKKGVLSPLEGLYVENRAGSFQQNPYNFLGKTSLQAGSFVIK
jgi:hypothetical protein